MLEPDENGLLLDLTPSVSRRIMAMAMLYALGGLLVWTGATQTGAIGWSICFIAIGIVALLGGERLRRATEHSIHLTVEGLQESTGRMLARYDEIAKVERGAFALKPSNGFVVILKEPQPTAWAPGLWWRYRRRVGVGGVIAARDARFVADEVARRLDDAPPNPFLPPGSAGGG